MMDVTLFRMDLSYELPFQRPIFEIVQPGAPILRTYYEALNPRFPIGMSDLHAPSASSLGDVVYRVVLFAGSGVLETSLTRFFARFERIQTQQDLKIVSDCVRLSEQALRNTVPQLETLGARIASASWFACEGGADAARDFLAQKAQAALDLDPSSYGGDSVVGTVGAEILSSEEKWSVRFRVEKSLLDVAQLYYHFEMNHLRDGRFGSFDERIQHAESLYMLILNRFGLTTKTKTQ